VVRATEGYTRDLAGHRRTMAPIYSLMIATAPLPDHVWDEIGLHTRPTFKDTRHLTIYGQRTADGRFAFGGRGAPYRFGSLIDPATERAGSVHDELVRTLRELFPVIGDVEVTHRWGGVLGAPATGFRPCASTAQPAWPRPSATSVTGSPPRSWPATRWPS
jgi:glycine/D-amino acid oxidase-like deaminating enzyme